MLDDKPKTVKRINEGPGDLRAILFPAHCNSRRGMLKDEEMVSTLMREVEFG